MVELVHSGDRDTVMPFGYSTTVKVTAIDNYVYLHGVTAGGEETTVPNTHKYMRIDNNSNYIFSVTKAYNRTTLSDVTSAITKVKRYYIHFDSNHVSDGDLIEMDIYVNWEGIRNDYNASDGTITKISDKLIEQLYRFVSNLDRTDFGNYEPPFKSVFDAVESSHNSIKYTYHPRIFFACNGYYNTDTKSGGSAVSGGPLTTISRNIINYSVGSTDSVGGFIGDPSFASTKGGNENYTVAPIPMYLTEMTFFCKFKNSSFDADVGEAIRLNFSIDGQSKAIGTAPKYSSSSGVYPIRGAFANDTDLILSFSGSSNYSGLPPAYKYAKELDDGDSGTEYYLIHRIPIGIVRINSGITVSASTVGLTEDADELSEYHFTIGGLIPTTWREV